MNYFAYGANMSMSHMAELCPSATFVGTAEARGWDFYIMPTGFGSIRPELTKSVFGLVWDIPDHTVSELDWYEDVGEGLYRKETIEVDRGDGKTASCLVYIGGDSDTGTPLPGYLEDILRHARKHSFPADYVRELERWLAL